MSLTEAFELYRLNCIAFKGQSPKTEESHMITLRSLKGFLGDIQVEDLTFIMVRDWKAHILTKCAPSTVRGYVIKLRVTLAYLHSNGYAVMSPEQIPVPQRVHKPPAYVTREQVAQMVACARRLRSKAIVSLLYGSGLRVSELIALDRTVIKSEQFAIVGKGGKVRAGFMDERTYAYVTAYLSLRTDKNPALFISTHDRKRMNASNVQLTVTAARMNAGILEKVTPHTLRHSFATDLLRNNTNPRHVQAMLGHRSLETTMRYMHVMDLDLQQVYRDKHKV